MKNGNRQASLVSEAVERASKGKVKREEALGRLLTEYASIALDRDENTKNRLEALRELIDRGLGRIPNNNVNLDVNLDVRSLSNDELEARILALLGSNEDLRARFGRALGAAGGTDAPPRCLEATG